MQKQQVSALRTDIQFDSVVKECSSRAAELGLDVTSSSNSQATSQTHRSSSCTQCHDVGEFQSAEVLRADRSLNWGIWFTGSVGIRALGRLARVLIDRTKH